MRADVVLEAEDLEIVLAYRDADGELQALASTTSGRLELYDWRRSR